MILYVNFRVSYLDNLSKIITNRAKIKALFSGQKLAEIAIVQQGYHTLAFYVVYSICNRAPLVTYLQGFPDLQFLYSSTHALVP